MRQSQQDSRLGLTARAKAILRSFWGVPLSASPARPRLGRRRASWRRVWAVGAALLLALSLVPVATAPAFAQAQATNLVSEQPPLNGQTIWTNQPWSFNLNVTADQSVANTVYATFGGQRVPQSPAQGQNQNPVFLNYNVTGMGHTPAPLTVAYTVSGQVYQDTANLGVQRSLLEQGPPSSTSLSFTVFPHGSATVDQSTLSVMYNNATYTPTSTPALTVASAVYGGATVSLQPTGGVTDNAYVAVTYSDNASSPGPNDYQAGFQASTATQWLTGTVVDASGAPVPGVDVMAFSSGGTGGFGEAVTGADGGFVVPVSATGDYMLQFNPPPNKPLVSVSREQTVVAGANSLGQITLQGAAVTVTGVVYDGATNPPQPLSQAFVNIFPVEDQGGPGGGPGTGPNAGGPSGGWAQTDASGQYTIYLTEVGRYMLNVQPPFGQNPDNLVAYNSPTPETLAAGPNVLPITLSAAAATVSGTVYYNNAPLANANINAMTNPGGPGQMGGFAWAQTDQTGHYTLQLGSGDWQLQVNGYDQATGTPLQGLQVAQSAPLSNGSLQVASGGGHLQIADTITLTPYDVPIDVTVPMVGGGYPDQVFAFAQPGTSSGGPGGGPEGPGLFANGSVSDGSVNSDGSAGDYATTHKVHLKLTAGTWQLGVAESSGTQEPRFKSIPMQIVGLGSGATVNSAVYDPHVTVTSGGQTTPALVSVSFKPRDQVIHVTVVDANNQPVSGVFVGAFRDNGDFVQGDGNTPMTNAQGQENVTVSKDRWQVGAFADGYGFTEPQTVDTSGGAGSYPITINLGESRPYTVSGTVTDAGSPVPGVQVVADQPGQKPSFGVTDPFGNYTLNVSAGSWSLSVEAPNYDTSGLGPWATSTALGSGNQAATVNIDLTGATQRNVQLSGTVVDASNNPVGGATVQVTQNNAAPVMAMTANDGTWQVDVSAGQWSVSAMAPGYASSQSVSKNVYADTPIPNITLHLGASLPDTLTGTVTDSSGKDVANAVVTAVYGSTGAVYQVMTAADGSYNLPVADGTYSIEVQAPGYVSQTTSNPVTVSAAGATTATTNFQLSAGTGVSGQVMVGGVAAGAGVEVDAVNVANSAQVVTTTTDANGNYSLGLSTGSWTLTAFTANHPPSTGIQVTVGAAPVTGQTLSIPSS